MSDENGIASDGSDRHRVDRRWAEQEHELYERHGRPSRPYYMKCLRCEEMWRVEGSLLRAEDAVRRHAGIHGGLKEEHAQIVAIDAHGRELFRTHAIFKPEDEPQGCPDCGYRRADDDRIACPNCGHIPEEDRLVPDGGTVEDGTEQTNHEKGERNEREAANILARVYGKGNVDKVSRYSNNDPLRFIDVLAAKDPYPVRFVQVKTNDFSPKQRLEYASVADKFDGSVKPEVWVRVDREGWRLYEFVGEPDEWSPYLEMDTCGHEDTVEAFREAVGFYGDRSVDTERSHSDDDLVTDGGSNRARYRRREVESVQQQAGVGDQGSACPHGVEDCPGPHGAVPCYGCFWEVSTGG